MADKEIENLKQQVSQLTAQVKKLSERKQIDNTEHVKLCKCNKSCYSSLKYVTKYKSGFVVPIHIGSICTCGGYYGYTPICQMSDCSDKVPFGTKYCQYCLSNRF